MCGISHIIFGSQVIVYFEKLCWENFTCIISIILLYRIGVKYFLKIYREAILLRLRSNRIKKTFLKSLFLHVNIPHKRILIKLILPWSDTPNWQGMGRKWLVECVFRSMCAQLALIWQPKNTKILSKLFHTSLSIFKALRSFSDCTHSTLAPSFQIRLISSKSWSHFRILKKAKYAHTLHSKSERPFT